MIIKKIFLNPFLWAFLIGIVSIHLVREFSLMRRSAPEPMVYVSDWNLIDQDGKSFGKGDLQGKLFIADFFFTSCPTICPKLTNAMKEVHKRFKNKFDNVHFVSISVDPTTDTPEVLKHFMKENDMDVANWHCLTGTKENIYDVISKKMRVHVGEKEVINEGLYDIPHLAHLALFDQNGNLRGLFRTDSTELASLVRATSFLLEKN